MKMVKKKDFALNKISLENALVEREVLMKSRHPFVVSLKYSFQDSAQIYFVMDYVAGGQLFDYMKKMKRFPLKMSRFYAAEVLLGLMHLHIDLDTIYRDLKPENILLEANGHIKLTDFGLSKVGQKMGYSVCGTPEYLAPEIIQSKCWALFVTAVRPRSHQNGGLLNLWMFDLRNARGLFSLSSQ